MVAIRYKRAARPPPAGDSDVHQAETKVDVAPPAGDSEVHQAETEVEVVKKKSRGGKRSGSGRAGGIPRSNFGAPSEGLALRFFDLLRSTTAKSSNFQIVYFQTFAKRQQRP